MSSEQARREPPGTSLGNHGSLRGLPMACENGLVVVTCMYSPEQPLLRAFRKPPHYLLAFERVAQMNTGLTVTLPTSSHSLNLECQPGTNCDTRKSAFSIE